ncbi:MAG: hypothetical protein A2487_00785 [Candidatus Raymondbacteria bacterium RifOxyC12_full_50_8]|uniref:Translocation and assembly module TamB C-terminal domain-containing protein n=1 Tax=Candidatus Raymondbacteria bacterium RIFOXYD12_FULL_49_13 TaxID=1817890 RepID=A0A1F7F9I3_UNCRA|nr:MAG: hypothetical protein A2350_03300 [Candidatus Raymondbacteria bacterium RifOxyB12_full_50_8]OGJ93262.1 MAG: hypothetical protein A2248_18005 [Candidatus Raymondbacteria bacterium RIFOXYA2_FULL_49_16]OGJ98167.1 MAG: hypothetical protein A2487_00785 [Candidatus Raymondbacteria bacterium RifOxyC12_full_50_8]OGK03344.1 MAG: hypothetical protein A2519_15350 [Candidatus Raymondbacteria bacterium RIFOXYD12_FULL_49_13]OGP44984.1 MAG: hypothetical protein A2324_19930 [Candidatus Raymondbacteria b
MNSGTSCIRFFRNIAAIVIAIIGLALVALWFGLAYGTSFVTPFVETKLQKVIGHTISIGSINTNVVSTITAKSIRISSLDSIHEEHPVVSLGRITMTYSLLDLVKKGRQFITACTMDSLLVYLDRDSAGIFNLALLNNTKDSTAAPDTSEITIPIQRLDIRHSFLVFKDSAMTGISVSLANADIHARQITTGGFSGGITADTCRITYKESLLLFKKIDLQWAWIAPNLEIPSFSFVYNELAVSGAGAFRYREKTVNIDTIVIQSTDGALYGAASVRFDTSQLFSMSLYADNAALSGLRGFWKSYPPRLRGNMQGRVTARGSLHNPGSWDLRGTLGLHHLAYGGKAIPAVAATVSILHDTLHFSLSQNMSAITAAIPFRDNQLRGSFSASLFKIDNLAKLAGVEFLEGDLNLTGDLAGTTSSPVIRARAWTRDLSFYNAHADSLAGIIEYRNNRVWITDARFSSTLNDIDSARPIFGLPKIAEALAFEGVLHGPIDSLSGAVSLYLVKPAFKDIGADNGSLFLTFQSTSVSLHSVLLQRGPLLLCAQGAIRVPELVGAYTLRAFGISNHYMQHELMDMVEADTLECAPVGFSSYGSVHTSFDLSDEQAISVTLRTNNLVLDSLGLFFHALPPMGGTCSVDVSLSGAQNNPRGEVAFSLRHPRMNAIHLDSVVGSFVLENGVVTVHDLGIHDSGSYLKGEALLPFTIDQTSGFSIVQTAPFRGSILAEKYDMALIGPLLPEKPILAGTLSCSVSWNGTLAQPNPTGEVSITSGSVGALDKAPLVRDLQASITIADSMIVVRRFSGSIKEVPFAVQGEIVHDAWSAMTIDLKATMAQVSKITCTGFIATDSMHLLTQIKNMALAPLVPLLPNIGQLSGTADTRLAVTGNPASPQIQGFVRIRDLFWLPFWTTTPFENGLCVLSFDKQTASLDTFQMTQGTGSVSIAGTISHANGRLDSAAIHASLKDIGIALPEVVTLSVQSGDMAFNGDVKAYALTGSLVFGKSRVVQDIDIKSIVPFLSTIEKPAKPRPAWMETIRLSIRVSGTNDIWIDNNLARVRTDPELTIIGNPVRPNINGRLSAEEGAIFFLDRKFLLDRCRIDFLNPIRPVPIVDLAATTHVNNYQSLDVTSYAITFSARGPLDSVVTELTADPYLDKPNIVSLLVLGVTRDQITGKDAKAGGALLERAGFVSTQKISAYLSKNVGSHVGLDELAIEGNLFNFGRDWNPALLASKKISKKFEITLKTKVGHLNENSVRLAYRLSDHFSLEGETDQEGTGGLDLKYGIRFE